MNCVLSENIDIIDIIKKLQIKDVPQMCRNQVPIVGLPSIFHPPLSSSRNLCVLVTILDTVGLHTSFQANCQYHPAEPLYICSRDVETTLLLYTNTAFFPP